MSFIKGLKNAGKSIGEGAVSPFAHAATGVEGIVKTAHNDVVGVTKGAYNITKGLSDDIGTSLTQLTSPIGLIAIAAVIGGIALIGMSSRGK